MKKIKLNSVCLISKFKKHLFYKDALLHLFEKEKEYSVDVDNYYTDKISKLDWSKSTNFNREWIKLIKKDLINHFNDCASFLGYQKIILKDLWFQQYKKGDTHGWHIHGENYTGVYYVEYNKMCGNTQLIDSFNQNKLINLNTKEGDIVLFPSTVIHRASIQKNDLRKTIISFNINFELIKHKLLKNLNKY
jgi:hypothetical protein